MERDPVMTLALLSLAVTGVAVVLFWVAVADWLEHR
jgi:hypothetical protein